jgi:hypothetical protein
MSVLPAPTVSSFKPTFVPEYFFEPASPTGGGIHAAVGIAPNSSSPDLESGAGESPIHNESHTEIEPGSHSKSSSSEAVAMDCDSEVDKQVVQQPQHCKELPLFLFAVPPAEASPQQSGDQVVTPSFASVRPGSISAGPASAMSTPSARTHTLFPGSMGVSSTTTSSASVSQVSSPVAQGVSGHTAKVYQRLVDAALIDEFNTATGGAPPQRGASESSRKYSTASTASAASSQAWTGSASTVDSPVSPGSAMNAPVSSSASAAHTPSPPPLTLPATGHRTNDTSSTNTVHSDNSKVTYPPASSPTRYRTVPASVSPVQISATHAPNTPVTHSQQQSHHHHAHTPKATHAQPHHHRHHTATHSTPATPQAHTTPHPRLQEPSALPSSHDPANPPEYVGPFILGPVLGRGCTGTVRLGTHRVNRFEVAFKIIDKKYLIGEQEGGASGNSTPTETEVEQSKLWKKVSYS